MIAKASPCPFQRPRNSSTDATYFPGSPRVEGRLPRKLFFLADHGFHEPLRGVVLVENMRARERDLDREQAAQADNREGRFIRCTAMQAQCGEPRRRHAERGCK